MRHHIDLLRILFFVTIILTGDFVFSEFMDSNIAEAREQKSRRKKTRKYKRQSNYRNTSKGVRGLSTLGILVKGGAIGKSSGVGVDGYMNMGNNKQLSLFWAQGSRSETFKEADITDYQSIKESFFAVQMRIFFGNSFYISPGVGYRQMTGNFTREVDSLEIEGTWSANSILGQIGIGNQWAFKNGFTIGADWFSYAPVLSGSSSVDSISSDDIEQKFILDGFKKRVEELSYEYSKEAAIQALGYIGYMF